MSRVQVVVDDRVRLRSADLPAEVREALVERFTYPNAKRAALRHMGLPWRREPETLRTWREEGGDLSLPRGGMGRAREVLRVAGLSWQVTDDRSEGLAELAGRLPPYPREPWPHQAEALAAWLPRQQGIVRAPTGSGKSVLGFMAAHAVDLATIVLVDTRALLDQWTRAACEELGMSARDVGIVQGPREVLRPLTIGMAHTVTKKAHHLSNVFGLLIFDEVHVAGASSFMGAADPLRAKYRLGISADERRKDKRDFLIYDTFGDVVSDVSRDALEDSGHVLDVQVVAVPTEFRADWYGLSEEEGDEKEIDFGRLLDEMAADEGRECRALAVIRREVTAGQQVLVMAHRVEHCQRLVARLRSLGTPAGLLIGGPEHRKEFQRNLTDLRSGELRVGVGTLQAIGKGLNLPKVGRVVAVTPIAGNRQFFGQVRGRACRAPTGKKDAKLFCLWDRECSFGPKHLRNMAAWNRTCGVLEGGAVRPVEKKRRLYAA